MSYLIPMPNRYSRSIAPLFTDLSAVWHDFDGIFEDLARSFESARFEADETDTAYSFTIALPGFKREQVTIEVTDDQILSVKATKGEHTVSRAITLPYNADAQKVEAKLEDGLLTITVGKIPQPTPRKVEVR